MTYILRGSKKISIRSDPAEPDDETVYTVPDNTPCKIIDDTPYYGRNDKEYIKVEADYKQGYVLREMVRVKNGR